MEREAFRFEKRGQYVSCGGFNKLGTRLGTSRMSGLVKARAKWLKDAKFYLEPWEVWRRQDVFVEMSVLRQEVLLEPCTKGRPPGRRTFWIPDVRLSKVF